MGRNTKINISIVVISTIATSLQTLTVAISSIFNNIALQIVTAVMNAIIVGLESLQLNIKRLKSRENSRRNSTGDEVSPRAIALTDMNTDEKKETVS